MIACVVLLAVQVGSSWHWLAGEILCYDVTTEREREWGEGDTDRQTGSRRQSAFCRSLRRELMALR